MLTYIYGIVFPSDEIAELCQQHNIDLCEDAAEAYLGNNYSGNKQATISMFSFGQIKRCTAFAGSICFVRDPMLYEKMNQINESYPTQDTQAYFKRILKFSVPFVALNNRAANFIICEAFKMLHLDVKEAIISRLRGFPSTSNYLNKFEVKPCTANISFLLHRLTNFDMTEYNEKISKLKKAVEFFECKKLLCPGYKCKERGFW